MDSNLRLWLIGGTSESAALAGAIATLQIPFTVTVTTASAKGLYPANCRQLEIRVGQLNHTTIQQFLQEQNIGAILDASHPHAAEISRLAIATSRQQNIPYLRYERPQIQELDKTTPESDVLHLDSFDTLVSGDYLAGQRVMLTLGYRTLPKFKIWQNRAVLFARILPSLVSLEVALNSGFTGDRIIAIRPPISAELEASLWQQWEISLAVTKASGNAGGEGMKRQVARELNVPLIIIDRPKISYPQYTEDRAIAIEFCRRHIPAF